jgi:hypothetical protein
MGGAIVALAHLASGTLPNYSISDTVDDSELTGGLIQPREIIEGTDRVYPVC